MPLYVYECLKCKRTVERLQTFFVAAGAELTAVDNYCCREKMRRVIFSTPFIFRVKNGEARFDKEAQALINKPEPRPHRH